MTFRLETDHKALEGLLTSKVLNRWLTRWALFKSLPRISVADLAPGTAMQMVCQGKLGSWERRVILTRMSTFANWGERLTPFCMAN